MKSMLFAMTIVAAGLFSFPSPGMALECNYYSRLPTIDQCTRESANSPRAKREGYSLAGIRRWCEQNQPTCYARAKKN